MKNALIITLATVLAACAPASPANDAATDTGANPADASMNNDAAMARPSCTAIEDACHPVEDRNMTTRECHAISENAASTEATCNMNLARCLAACSDDAGASGG